LVFLVSKISISANITIASASNDPNYEAHMKKIASSGNSGEAVDKKDLNFSFISGSEAP
jgi:hypothetical protein